MILRWPWKNIVIIYGRFTTCQILTNNNIRYAYQAISLGILCFCARVKHISPVCERVPWLQRVFCHHCCGCCCLSAIRLSFRIISIVKFVQRIFIYISIFSRTNTVQHNHKWIGIHDCFIRCPERYFLHVFRCWYWRSLCCWVHVAFIIYSTHSHSLSDAVHIPVEQQRGNGILILTSLAHTHQQKVALLKIGKIAFYF